MKTIAVVPSVTPAASTCPSSRSGHSVAIGADGLSAFDRAGVEAVLRDFNAYEAQSVVGAMRGPL